MRCATNLLKSGGHNKRSKYSLTFENNKVKGLPLDAQAFVFTYLFHPCSRATPTQTHVGSCETITMIGLRIDRRTSLQGVEDLSNVASLVL